MVDYLFLFNSPAPASSSLLKEFLSNNNIFNKENNGESSTSYLLNKASVIHSIRERTANGSVPEGILDSLQIIEELDRKQGLPVSDSLRAAFCAVAVHSTLTSLPLSWPSYFDSVQRIWRLRIQNLEDSGTTQLLGPGLAKWRDDVEAALWDSDTSQRLLRINTHNEAMRSIRAYLGEARSSMKPAFLRLALASTAGPTVDPVAPAQAPSSPHRCTDKGKRIMGMNSQTRFKLRSSLRRHKGPVIIATSEKDRPSCSKFGSLSTPEVKKLQEALKSSTADLLAAVTDPLPEALEVAERVASYMAGKNFHAKADLNKDKGVPSASFNPTRKPSQAEGNSASPNQNNVLRPSLMERNGTACTYEWEDSIDVSSEGTTSCSNRCRLPSPKIKPVSPLKERVTKKWTRKRKINRWSLEEEKALREGVEQHGAQWKLILTSNPEAFINRTPVDLKDKWRNMSEK